MTPSQVYTQIREEELREGVREQGKRVHFKSLTKTYYRPIYINSYLKLTINP